MSLFGHHSRPRSPRNRNRLPFPRALAAVTAVACAGSVAVASPLGSADPLPDLSSDAPERLSSLAPRTTELLNPFDELGRPRPELLDLARDLANEPWMPQEAREVLLAAAEFFSDDGEGGPPLPDNPPPFTQFYWPTASGHCIGGTEAAVGTALAVRGPAEIPAPGAPTNADTVFLFTALGTGPAAPEHDMRVNWVNLTTLEFGSAPLGDHDINPEGPTTVSATAATGSGPVAAVLSGTVNTADGPCTFFPTAAFLPAA